MARKQTSKRPKKLEQIRKALKQTPKKRAVLESSSDLKRRSGSQGPSGLSRQHSDPNQRSGLAKTSSGLDGKALAKSSLHGLSCSEKPSSSMTIRHIWTLQPARLSPAPNPMQRQHRSKPQPTTYHQSHDNYLDNDALENSACSPSKQEITDYPFRIPLSSHEGIVVVGDGDFSFSLAMARLFQTKSASDQTISFADGMHSKAGHLIFTAYDSRDTLMEKYPSALANLTQLEQSSICHPFPAISILFGVDGTALHQTSNQVAKLVKRHGLFVTRIIFNFPHTGAGIKDRARNIRANQTMVAAFFKSAHLLCQMSRAQWRISNPDSDPAISAWSRQSTSKPKHLRSKSPISTNVDSYSDPTEIDCDHHPFATPPTLPMDSEIHVTLRTGDPYDDWDVKRLGSLTAGLKYFESFRFEPQKYHGYQHVCTKGSGPVSSDQADQPVESDNEFLQKPAKTFVFRII